jgi:hypothetical protein
VDWQLGECGNKVIGVCTEANSVKGAKAVCKHVMFKLYKFVVMRGDTKKNSFIRKVEFNDGLCFEENSINSIATYIYKTKLRGLSPRANYTD